MPPRQGNLLRDAGIAAVAYGNEDWIDEARALAVQIATERGRVSSDDIWERLPPPETVDPRVMGAVFHRSRFKRVGFAISKRPACHSRPIAVWALKE